MMIIYNESHSATARARVYAAKYDPKECSIAVYGQEIKTAAMSLGYQPGIRDLWRRS